MRGESTVSHARATQKQAQKSRPGHEETVCARRSPPPPTMGAKQCSGYDRTDMLAGDKKHSVLSYFTGGSVHEDTAYFGWAALFMQLTLIGFYCLTDYEFGSETVFDGETAMQVLLGTMVFAVAGMGLSGTWMRAFGISAFGFGLVIMVFALQEAMLVEGWMRSGTLNLKLCELNFITGMRGVVCVLISWGAMAGKISPVIMLFFSLCEVAVYYANKVYILENTFNVIDIGGAISIHVFGAFFGVCCCLGLSLIPYMQLHESSHQSDVMSAVGTGLMWIYFPTFVASGAQMNTAAQRTAIMNTIFALLGSTGAAFATGPLFNPQGLVLTTDMLRLSTLAGGVAISSIAHLQLGPGGALLVGTLGGMCSSWLCHLKLYDRRQLVEKLELADSYGVMYLSGLPGVLSAVISMALPLLVKNTGIVWMDQFLGLLTTISLACVSGFITGRLAKSSATLFPIPDLDFNDSTYWNAKDVPNHGLFGGN